MTKIWRDLGLANQYYFTKLFAKTLKFFISVMAFKEIRQTLFIQIDFLAMYCMIICLMRQ